MLMAIPLSYDLTIKIRSRIFRVEGNCLSISGESIGNNIPTLWDFLIVHVFENIVQVQSIKEEIRRCY